MSFFALGAYNLKFSGYAYAMRIEYVLQIKLITETLSISPLMSRFFNIRTHYKYIFATTYSFPAKISLKQYFFQPKRYNGRHRPFSIQTHQDFTCVSVPMHFLIGIGLVY